MYPKTIFIFRSSRFWRCQQVILTFLSSIFTLRKLYRSFPLSHVFSFVSECFVLLYSVCGGLVKVLDDTPFVRSTSLSFWWFRYDSEVPLQGREFLNFYFPFTDSLRWGYIDESSLLLHRCVYWTYVYKNRRNKNYQFFTFVKFIGSWLHVYLFYTVCFTPTRATKYRH